MFVLKFGGSSVESSTQLLNVLDIIRSHKHSYDTNKVVVLSACKGITDKLQAAAIAAATALNDKTKQSPSFIYDEIKAHHLQIIEQTLVQYKTAATQSVSKLLEELNSLLQGISYLNEITPASTDAVLAFGELLSTTLLHYICLENSLPSVLLDTRDMIITDDNYGAARPLTAESEYNIKRVVNNAFSSGFNLVITQGFIASYRGKSLSDIFHSPQSDLSDISRAPRESICKTTTLGRGGSDYTAALLGAALNAEEIQIWTDVNGILSADPRVCRNACTIRQMEFGEVQDLSYWGAKVIHPDTIAPAIERNIPIRVLNSFNPVNSGTLIKSGNCGESFTVKSIIAKQHCLYFTSPLKPSIRPADAILYCGKAGGLYVTLLDSRGYSTDCSFKELANSRGLLVAETPCAFPLNEQLVECLAICITGGGLQQQTGSDAVAVLAASLAHIGNAKLENVIYNFFANSIILVLSNTNNINEIVQKLHTNIVLPFLSDAVQTAGDSGPRPQ